MSDPKTSSHEPDAGALAWGPGIAIGLGFGLAVGVAVGNIGVGVAMAMGIGVTFAVIFGTAAKRRRDASAHDGPGDVSGDEPPSGAV